MRDRPVVNSCYSFWLYILCWDTKIRRNNNKFRRGIVVLVLNVLSKTRVKLNLAWPSLDFLLYRFAHSNKIRSTCADAPELLFPLSCSYNVVSPLCIITTKNKVSSVSNRDLVAYREVELRITHLGTRWRWMLIIWLRLFKYVKTGRSPVSSRKLL
jgi:hypothetical protein